MIEHARISRIIIIKIPKSNSMFSIQMDIPITIAAIIIDANKFAISAFSASMSSLLLSLIIYISLCSTLTHIAFGQQNYLRA